ncbi:MAG: Mrp/NBP35 family ATP-binding protein [Bacteroidales bacterium]|nr:Mrp/NBP35 family ATP-binding protein [Bacteroidales bacterium]
MACDENCALKRTKLENIHNIVVVASGKGGVGKSTVTANLALSLAKQGYRVGVLDADIYGPSIHKMFGIEGQPVDATYVGEEEYLVPVEKYGMKIISLGLLVDNKQAVIWRGPMAAGALSQLFSKTQWGELDYLVVDFPPGTGDIQISTMQQFEVDGAIVVTTPQVLAVNDARKGAEMFSANKMNVPLIGIVENMSWFTPKEHPTEKYLLFGKGGGQKLADEFHTQLLAQIPLIQDVEEIENQDCLLSTTNEEIFKAFEAIADKTVDFLEKLPPREERPNNPCTNCSKK